MEDPESSSTVGTEDCCETSLTVANLCFSRISSLDFSACLPEFSQPGLLEIPLYSLVFVEHSQFLSQISSKINHNISHLLDSGVLNKVRQP